MAKLYSNENFPMDVVRRLRQLGHDVLTSYEAGQANQRIPDDEVLAFATSQERIVVTLNRTDFIRLHKQGISHRGIVVCTNDPDFQRQAERIDAALVDQGTMENQLVRVNRPDPIV
jgi:uncharacterized protein with PIN domain